MSEDIPPERRTDFRRGMELLREIEEVMPDEAEGEVAVLYDEIRAELRVPFVNLLFRVLANHPEPFREAWRAVRPSVGTAGFERAADHLRAAAAAHSTPATAAGDWSTAHGLAQVRAFTASIHYVLPKLLLLAVTFDRLFGGGPGEGAGRGGDAGWLGVDPDDPLPRGPAPGTITLDLVDPNAAEGVVARVFTEIRERHGHPGVASYYRALAHWPDLLAAVWREVEPELGNAERVRRKANVVRLAHGLSAAALGPTRSSLAGAASAADLRAILSVFRYRLVPDLLLDVSRIRALIDGQGAAFGSPFSFHRL